MDAALIENGVVTQVWRGQTLAEISNLDDLNGTVIPFEENIVVCGQLWDGMSLTNPPPSPRPDAVPPAEGSVVQQIIVQEPSAELDALKLADAEKGAKLAALEARIEALTKSLTQASS